MLEYWNKKIIRIFFGIYKDPQFGINSNSKRINVRDTLLTV